MGEKRISELLRFYISGGVEAVIALFMLYILRKYTEEWYLLVSLTVDIVNISLGFAMKKFWVFKGEQTKKTPKQILLSIIIFFMFLIINASFMYLFIEHLKIQFIIAKIISAIILSIISYFLNKKIVFTK